MSNSLRVAWVKPVILALVNPVIPLPNPPPLQISDYTTNPASPHQTILVLSDARHRIQAYLDPSALSAHSSPLSSLRGAIITLTKWTLSYVLTPTTSLPGTPLDAKDEFVLQVQAFNVVGSGGSGEVGHPHDCMQDREVKRTMQTIKDISLDERRALVTAHATTLYPHYTPKALSLPPPPDSTLPPPAMPAIPAELAQWEAPSTTAYLQQYLVPAQAQAILDGMEPKGPAVQGEVEEMGEMQPSQWSSSREEEEKAVFSQFSPLRTRLPLSDSRPLPNVSPSPAPPLSTSAPSAPRTSALAVASAVPELPRLEEDERGVSPPQSQAPASPPNDDFYATQAPLSLISPPLSPSSLSSVAAEDERERAMEEEKADQGAEEEHTAASLSQHNLPLSTFDVDAMRDDASSQPSLPAAAPQPDGAAPGDDANRAAPADAFSQMPDSHSADSPAGDDDVHLLDAPAEPSPHAEPLTQAPMSQALSQPSQEALSPASPPSSAGASSSPARGLDLTLPPPYPSSMPPLSPGTPSPQKAAAAASQRRRTSPGRAAQRRPPSPLPRVTIEVKREEKEGERGAGDEDDAAQLFSASSIHQRQQLRAQQLLSQRCGTQTNGEGRGAQKRLRVADADGEGVGRWEGGSDKRQRTVRFSDEGARGREERKEREGGGVARPLNEQPTLTPADVDRLSREARVEHLPWSGEDYQLIVSYWRSRGAS